MNTAAVPENPYPPRPEAIYAMLRTVAAIGLVAAIVAAPSRPVTRAFGRVSRAVVTMPFARRARRHGTDRPLAVSYFGTGA